MWYDMVIVMALTAIKAIIKNPPHAAKLRAVLLEIRDDITLAFPDAPPKPAAQLAA